MKIRHLDISRFRGIQALNWTLPENNIVCLIGRGDSGKSTILDAIRYVLYPTWNPSFDEFDFFHTDTNSNIEITLTLVDLPEDFLSDAKYGLYLRGWDSAAKCIVDEPREGLEVALSIKLAIDKGLEPKWTVVCDRFDEGKAFKVGDRIKAYATYIGAYADTHLTWSKNSALSRITVAENISGLLSEASRAAKQALDADREAKLSSFDAAASLTEGIARNFGVPVSEQGAYKAQLDTGAINIRMGGLSLHDQQIPLRRLGLGSRRMLTFGIQQEGLSEPHITLIDEVEIGLEPHRIARLLRKLNEDQRGQYFITTHSPVVLRELTVEQLSVTQIQDNQHTVTCAAIPSIKENIQGKIRKSAESFLAKKIIVCEGATEVGICRGLDNFWTSQGGEPFSFFGLSMFDAGGGSKMKPTAEAIKQLGYDVLVIGDSDANDGFSEAHAQTLRNSGVSVIRWEGDVSIEEYFFKNLPWEAVIGSINLAKSMHGDRVIQQIQAQHAGLDGDPDSWQETDLLRDAIGRASLGNSDGQNAWFKRQDRAEDWVLTIKDALNNCDTPIGAHVNTIKTWVDNA